MYKDISSSVVLDAHTTLDCIYCMCVMILSGQFASLSNWLQILGDTVICIIRIVGAIISSSSWFEWKSSLWTSVWTICYEEMQFNFSLSPQSSSVHFQMGVWFASLQMIEIKKRETFARPVSGRSAWWDFFTISVFIIPYICFNFHSLFVFVPIFSFNSLFS